MIQQLYCWTHALHCLPAFSTHYPILMLTFIVELRHKMWFNRWHQTTSQLRSNTNERSLEATTTMLEIITHNITEIGTMIRELATGKPLSTTTRGF